MITKEEAVFIALLNRAGSGTMSDRYIRERVVPGFLDELKKHGWELTATPRR